MNGDKDDPKINPFSFENVIGRDTAGKLRKAVASRAHKEALTAFSKETQVKDMHAAGRGWYDIAIATGYSSDEIARILQVKNAVVSSPPPKIKKKDRDAMIVREYISDPHPSMREIGKSHGISAAVVSMVISRARKAGEIVPYRHGTKSPAPSVTPTKIVKPKSRKKRLRGKEKAARDEAIVLLYLQHPKKPMKWLSKKSGWSRPLCSRVILSYEKKQKYLSRKQARMVKSSNDPLTVKTGLNAEQRKERALKAVAAKVAKRKRRSLFQRFMAWWRG